MDDILGARAENKEVYRVGTLILHKTMSEGREVYHIVDGQQRIITFSLLLKAFGCVMPFLQEKIPDNQLYAQNILSNYALFSRRIEKYKGEEKERLLEYIKTNCELIVVITENLSEAFQFFDSQNARGKKLYPHDLLKAYHLREMRNIDAEETEKIVKTWEDMNQRALSSLFADYLYRIKVWIKGNKADEFMQTLNAVANNGGRVIAHFICASSSGDYFECTSSQFSMDRSQDELGQTENGYTLSLATDISADYAYINTGKSGGLDYDRRKSTSLDRGVRLVVLGFPFGLGAKSVNDIAPIYGNAIVATQGLEDGVILTTDTNYESGNSGGPALLADESGKLTVVGIVSASAGRNIGFIVPINSL